MADIKLDIDVSSIAKAKKALKDFSNQSDKLGRSVMAAGKKVQSVSSGWAEANKMYKQGVLNSKQLSQAQVELARELAVINGYTKKNGSLNTDRALRELKAAEAAKDNARATQEAADAARKQAREIDRLKGKFVANYGASQKYKKEIRDLIRAKRQGIVTTDQYGDAVQRLKSDFRDVQNGVARGSNQFASYNTATYRANQSTKRFASVGLQQVGYQVGDFAVQLQGGTNAAVAFGQQFSQLAGIFGAGGAIAGAGVAIATAFIAPLLDAKKEAKELNKVFEETSSIIDDAVSSFEGMSSELENLNALGGNYSRVSKEIASIQRDINFQNAVSSLDEATSSISDADGVLGKFRDTLKVVLDLQDGLGSFQEGSQNWTTQRNSIRQNTEELQYYADQMGTNIFTAEKLVRALEDMGNAEGVAETASAAENLRSAFVETYGVYRDMSEEQRKIYDALVQSWEQAQRLKALEEGRLRVLESQMQSQQDRINIVRAEIRYGEDSIQAKQVEEQIEARILRLKLESLGADEDRVKAIMDAWRAANQLESSQQAISGTATTLETLWGNIKDRVAGAADEAVRFSENLALGQDFLNAKVRSGVEAGTIPPQALDDLPPTAAESAYQNFLEAQRRQARSGGSGSSSGGSASGGAAQAAQEVEKLNDSLSRNQQLLKDVGKTMSQSFGDALMSVVDGSKSAADAFKDMARQILKQAFDMLVVKPIMDSIMGFFGGGQISGPSFGMGSRANFAPPPRPFADGGVVNGPTVFPMANGTGLMGEAGPEAIMPLKRGKNGKLGVQSEGGQGNVTVENHFHISANGDDSVKRIIQQEAPKIANYTQQQILDQRRRGGAMKSTFGG